jgi:UDP-glucose 4-epimerase
MSFLLVGGFGFIGKHFIEATIDNNYGFTVIARKDPDAKWMHHAYVLDNTLDDNAMSDLAKRHKVIVYLASSSIPSTGSFLREITENVEPALNLIDRLTGFNPDLKVIYLSSGGQIYGNDYLKPVNEEAICKPMSPYGYGKLMVEDSLAYLHRTKGTKISILRVANPVGRWQTGLRQGIVNVVFQALKNNRPVMVFGNGNECRDYIDADDLAQLILLVAHSDFSFKIWNVGSGQATSTIQLLSKIEHIVGSVANKEYLPRRRVDPEFAVLDCSKVLSDLGWQVTKNIDDILQKTLSFKIANERHHV